MDNQLNLVSLLVFLSVFLLTVLLFMAADLRARRKDTKRQSRGALFDAWEEGVFDLFFRNRDPRAVAKSFGFDGDEYLASCDIARLIPNLKRVIMHKLIGLLLVVGGTVAFFATKNYYVSAILLLTGMLLYEYRGRQARWLAKRKADSLQRELPRFADMLEMGLSINMPVEQAIMLTAKYMPESVLAEEFNDSIAEMQMGAKAWQEALKEIALKYNCEDFSDFVLSLVTAYEKGVSIAQTVHEKSRNMKQSTLLLVKERANRMNSTILFPIVIFKLLPLLVLMMLPIIIQLRNMSF